MRGASEESRVSHKSVEKNRQSDLFIHPSIPSSNRVSFGLSSSRPTNEEEKIHNQKILCCFEKERKTNKQTRFYRHSRSCQAGNSLEIFSRINIRSDAWQRLREKDLHLRDFLPALSHSVVSSVRCQFSFGFCVVVSAGKESIGRK